MGTESTRRACAAHDNGRVIFRPLGRIQVQGRSAAVPIYEIAGLTESFPDQGRECIALFSQALDRYYEQDWDGAAALFQRSAELELLTPVNSPGVRTTPSLVYIDIIARQRHEPRRANWDGVYVMKEK
jgi:adenylate cyclase